MQSELHFYICTYSILVQLFCSVSPADIEFRGSADDNVDCEMNSENTAFNLALSQSGIPEMVIDSSPSS